MPATTATATPDAGGRLAAALEALRPLCALAAVALVLATAGPGTAATARIQYLSSSAVYLDAGSAAGLTEDMQVQVERDGKVIATLVVDFVAQNSASCRVHASTDTLRPDDVVTFTPVAAPALRPPAALGPSTSAWSHRGRIGMLFLRSEDAFGRFDHPVLWVELAMNGSEQRQVAFRFRGDSPQQTLFEPVASPGSRHARVYEATLRYRSAQQRFEVEAGRLLPQRLELLGALDGGGALWRPTRGLRLAVAGGRGTDASTTPSGSAGAKVGGFIEIGPGGRRRASLAFGRVDDSDVTRRQYMQLRSDAAWRRVRLFENLEIDLAPEWKTEMGEDAVELTALSMGAQAFVRHDFDFSLGYEARRALLVPEQRFLPSVAPRELQHSVRGSTRYTFARQWSLRLGGDVRRAGAGGSISRFWDALLSGSRLGPVTLSLHMSNYDTEQARGDIIDGSLHFTAGARTRVDLAGGSNHTRTAADIAGGAEPDVRWGWLRGGLGVDAGRGLWLRGAAEWRTGGQGHELSVELDQQF